MVTSSSENTDRPAAGPGEPATDGVSPETRVERFKRWAENNRVLAALSVIAAIVAGAAAFTKSIRELRDFVVFLETPRLEAVAGPGLLLAYERTEPRVTFKFALALLHDGGIGHRRTAGNPDARKPPAAQGTRRRSGSRRYWRAERGGDAALRGTQGGLTGQSLHPLGLSPSPGSSEDQLVPEADTRVTLSSALAGRTLAVRRRATRGMMLLLDLVIDNATQATAGPPRPPTLAGGMMQSSHLAASSPGSMAVSRS
jgi:hypothetical protein